ncbi:uncharacterized protein si:dkey-29h14.10 [Dicentrarchus labrax]|uniref:uncharacterized protein si:dkey-29h14.10 n=1 Tax=Dicentrarchus labrax TaxID=13489 RepID=UPI0021F600B8|nr:uncharacterized protein si:dkey-29h14.10 [Dicentrarchus labrax]
MMDSSDPLTLRPFNNSNFSKTKERTPFYQVMTCKDSSLQRIIQVVQRVAQKSCRRACQLFCCPLDTLLCEKLTACPAPNHQPEEDKNAQVALRSPPSTILILNISNSTLIDCVIGNDTYPSAVAESQPLMHESELHMHDQARCGCSCGAAQTSPPPPAPLPAPAEPPRISIHSSHLNCVIIGNNNYMQAEQSDYTETNEPQV